MQVNTTKPYRVESGVLVIDEKTPLIYTYKGMVGSYDTQLNPKVYWATNVKEVVTWYKWASQNIQGFSNVHRKIWLRRLINGFVTNNYDLSMQPVYKLASNLYRSQQEIQGTPSKFSEIVTRLGKFEKEAPQAKSFSEFSRTIVETDSQIEDLNAELIFALLVFSLGIDVKLSKDPDLMLEKHRVEIKRIRGIYTSQKQKALEERAFIKQGAEILVMNIGYF